MSSSQPKGKGKPPLKPHRVNWTAWEYVSIVKEHQASFYKESGQLGPSIEIREPYEHERACDPLGLHEVVVYEAVLKLLNFYGIAPCQLSPNGWTLLLATIALMESRGYPPSLVALNDLLTLRTCPSTIGWMYLQPRYDLKIFKKVTSKNLSWRQKFFVLSMGPRSGWNVSVF
mgnify:CR=1 FL=1